MALTQVPSEAIADGAVGTSKLADGAATTNKMADGALDRIRVATAHGSDTLDAGSVNIIYE